MGPEAALLRRRYSEPRQQYCGDADPITCCTLDRLALTAKFFVEKCVRAGYRGEFDGFTVDHRAAYRTVRASNVAFRRVVPILHPGSGCVFFVEYDVLLFGEEASVLGYNSVARIACIIACRVLGIHLDHYYDDLVPPAKAEDGSDVLTLSSF